MEIKMSETRLKTYAEILDVWKENLGENLYKYNDKEMISRTPSPVGKRMNPPLLRPNTKFLEKNK